MKRIKICAFACALFVFAALAGCGSNSTESAASASASAASVSASAAASVEAESSAAAPAADAASSSSAAAPAADVASSSGAAAPLQNGEYIVDFDTDSSMFHVNEVDEGTGVLTVNDEGMTVHIRLVSKKITKLYVGKAEQAKADTANQIQPTTDTVTYSDGIQEEVYGFDVPVPALDEPFDVAILGSKGNWYDHVVTVSNPVAK